MKLPSVPWKNIAAIGGAVRPGYGWQRDPECGLPLYRKIPILLSVHLLLSMAIARRNEGGSISTGV